MKGWPEGKELGTGLHISAYNGIWERGILYFGRDIYNSMLVACIAVCI